jgi:IS30 family transposase
MQDMGKHISPQDRDQIATLRARGILVREIARRLGFSHTSIGRELQRNGWRHGYVAIHAQVKIDTCKKEAGTRHPLKDAKTYSFVLARSRSGWSPEQIAG